MAVAVAGAVTAARSTVVPVREGFLPLEQNTVLPYCAHIALLARDLYHAFSHSVEESFYRRHSCFSPRCVAALDADGTFSGGFQVRASLARCAPLLKAAASVSSKALSSFLCLCESTQPCRTQRRKSTRHGHSIPKSEPTSLWPLFMIPNSLEAFSLPPCAPPSPKLAGAIHAMNP